MNLYLNVGILPIDIRFWQVREVWEIQEERSGSISLQGRVPVLLPELFLREWPVGSLEFGIFPLLLGVQGETVVRRMVLCSQCVLGKKSKAQEWQLRECSAASAPIPPMAAALQHPDPRFTAETQICNQLTQGKTDSDLETQLFQAPEPFQPCGEHLHTDTSIRLKTNLETRGSEVTPGKSNCTTLNMSLKMLKGILLINHFSLLCSKAKQKHWLLRPCWNLWY